MTTRPDTFAAGLEQSWNDFVGAIRVGRFRPKELGLLWKLFSSVWLAVGLMIVIAVMSLVGHVLEIKEAEEVFFRSWWFTGVLATLWINIFVCTLSRSPWRLSQAPFLMVHLGLLTLLSAGVLTARSHDGQLSVQQGTRERLFVQEQCELVVEGLAADGRIARDSRDVHLTHFPKGDLQTRLDAKLLALGIGFWALLAGLGFCAGAKIGGRYAGLLVLAIVVGFGLWSCYVTWHAWRWVVFKGEPGEALLTLSTYYPHHSLEERVTADPTGEGPAALELLLRSPSPRFRKQTEMQRFWLVLGTERESVSLGPPGRELAFTYRKIGRETELDEICGVAPVRTAAVVVSSKKNPSERTRLEVPTAIGHAARIAGYTVRLARVVPDVRHPRQHGHDGMPAYDPADPLVDPLALLDVGTDALAPVTTKAVFGRAPANPPAKIQEMTTHPDLAFEWDIPAAAAPDRSVNFIEGPEPGRVRFFATLNKSATTLGPLEVKRNELVPLSGIMPMLAASYGETVEHGSPGVEPVYVDPHEVPREEKPFDAVLARLEDRSGHSDEHWLSTRGRDSADFDLGGKPFRVSYRHKATELPFEIELKKFTVEKGEGEGVSGYRSDVVVHDPKNGIDYSYPIYMNHTLVYGGYTFFQSQFSPIEGAPVSIFAVSDDQGGYVFYVGWGFMTIGVFMIFYVKPWLRRVERRRARARFGLPPETPEQEREAIARKLAPGKRVDDVNDGDRKEIEAARPRPEPQKT
ncbi:cytochrome c biogenesis protein ResB [bacterium]|nr:cytochrome c biogenesis protein ResB [bacterium]